MMSVEQAEERAKMLCRIAEAITQVTRDTHGIYDECFIERLLESASDFLKSNRMATESSAAILALVKLYEAHEFKDQPDINITRLFKFHKTMLEADSRTAHLNITEFFFKKLPTIMRDSKPSEVSSALTLLQTLSYDDVAFRDIKTKEFVDFYMPSNSCKDPLKSKTMTANSNANDSNTSENAMQTESNVNHITDVPAIAKYYLLTTNNYHVQENAKYLFISLFMKSSEETEPSLLVNSMKKITENFLMINKSQIVYQTINELFDIAPTNCLVTEYFQYLKLLLRKAFDRAVEDQSSLELVNLSKCLAVARISDNETIEKLKQTKNLEAIIRYVTHINVFTQSSLWSFIMYPILIKCDSEDALVLTSRLFMTREEKYFIERNLSEKLVQQCLTYLKHVTGRELSFVSTAIPHKKLIYALEVVLEYLKCHYESPKTYKNVLLCCKILADGLDRFITKTESIWSFHLTDVLCELIERTNLDQSPHLRQTFLELLHLLTRSHYKSTLFQASDKLDKIGKNWLYATKKAFQYSDPDILYEFANLFYVQRDIIHVAEDSLYENYVRLIWEHMLPVSMRGDHHELLGVVASLLIRIDLNFPLSVFDLINIRQHRDIPKLICEILTNFSTAYKVSEKVISCITSVDAVKDLPHDHQSDGRHWFHTRLGYLEWLNNNGHPRAVKGILDKLVRAVCFAIKNECNEHTKRIALIEMNSLIKALSVNEESPERMLKRLIRTGILETLHEISCCSLYSEYLQKIASEEIPRIKKYVLDKLGTAETVSDKIISLLVSADYDNQTKHDRAKKVADFFTSYKQFKRFKEDLGDDTPTYQLGLDSYLNDILDYKKADWGPLECY